MISRPFHQVLILIHFILLQGTFTAVTGTFTVPTPTGSDGSSSAWVGIDGDTCGSAILQTGVDFTISGGQVSYDGEFPSTNFLHKNSHDCLSEQLGTSGSPLVPTISTTSTSTLEMSSLPLSPPRARRLVPLSLRTPQPVRPSPNSSALLLHSASRTLSGS